MIQTHTNIVVGDGTIQGARGSTDRPGVVAQREFGPMATAPHVAYVQEGSKEGGTTILFCGFCGAQRVDQGDIHCVSCGRKFKVED